MRRPREDSSSIAPAPPRSNVPSSDNDQSTTRPPAKRPKTSQACTSCRKHKTRCEFLHTASRSRCHRCDVLSITCSFETNAPPTQAAEFSPNPIAVFRQRLFNAILSTPQRNSDKCLEQTSSDARCSSSRSTTTSPWDIVKVPGIADWSATPMLAMLTLSKMARTEQPMIQPVSNLTFTEILTGDQRQYLLRLFESHYAPWLSLPPNALEDDPVLNLIRCTIASRHLESSTHAVVFPTLRRLTEEAIVEHIFNPSPSLAIIQSFALLALWSPFDTPSSFSSETRDSRLIIAAAVNMCSALRCDQAASDEEALQERRKLGAKLTLQETALLATAEQKKLLWTCVHNIESIVCIGTGRGISSKTTPCTPRTLSPLNFSTLENARRDRMLLAKMTFDLTEGGLRLEIPEDADNFDTFCDESAEILWRLDGIQRLITSVHVVTDFEVFHAHMLVVYFYFCRLAFLSHTLCQMRMHIPPAVVERAGTMFFSSKVSTRTGCGFALTCGRDALSSSEALLSTILSIKDKSLLATAPDSVFAMISYAAAHVTTARFLVLQAKALRHFPGVSRELLARTIKCLHQISLSTDDNASRCARVISGFLDLWNDKQDMQETHDPEATSKTRDLNDSPQAVSALLSSASNSTPREYASSESTMVGPSQETTPLIGEYDYIFNLDQDPLLGLDFWSYLGEMPNIQPEPDINESYTGS